MKLLSRDNLRISARRYLCGILFYGTGFFFYNINIYYKGFITHDTLLLLKSLYVTYIVAALPILIFQDKSTLHKPTIALKGFFLLFTRVLNSFSYNFIDKRYSKKPLDSQAKNAILFSLVKLFYIPLMLNFFFENYRGLLSYFFISGRLAMPRSFGFNDFYGMVLTLIFTIDTMFFAFGYLVEHKIFNNTIKSVEPTLLGWVVALASYPPFNTISTGFLNWYSNDYFVINNSIFFNIVCRSIVLLLLGLYLWATLSLGTRCSNLTNRGIVTTGAYKHIRHPAYTGKVLAWFLMTIPVFSIWSVLSVSSWATIYYLRAITEERHLAKDPDYLEYVKKTKYRFIPGIV